jgi:hypothetical protein
VHWYNTHRLMRRLGDWCWQQGRNPGVDFATVAYAAATGAPLWVRRYHAPIDRYDTPGEVLVSPRGGGTVVVSGANNTGGNVSVAYSAAAGRTRPGQPFPS